MGSEAADERWYSRFEISGRSSGDCDSHFGSGPKLQNKPNGLNFRCVNQIQLFRTEQTQVIYLPCYQLDGRKFGSFSGRKCMHSGPTIDQGFWGKKREAQTFPRQHDCEGVS